MSNKVNTTKTINAVATIEKSQLKDDLEAKLSKAGFTLKEYEAMQRQMEYRRQYSQRPEVKEKRKQYQQERYERMKMLRELVSGK